MNRHRNTTATIRAVLAAAQGAGVDIYSVLAEAGVSREVAFDPDGEVSLETMKRFWQSAYRITGDPYLAVNGGIKAAQGSYKTLDYLLVSATTLRDGLSRFFEHFRLINTWLNFELESTEAAIHVVLHSNIGPVPPPAVELTFVVLTERVRSALGTGWSPVSVDFLHAPKGDPGFYEGYFRCPVRFSAEAAQMSFSREDCDRSLPDRDDGLFRVLVDHARLLSAERTMPDDMVTQAKQEILRRLGKGLPVMEGIAADLGVSARTLQRRLSDRQETFSGLVDQVRQDQARDLVSGMNMSLSEIAFFLGFSDQSAFSRAFKRWTGQTPKKFRSAI